MKLVLIVDDSNLCCFIAQTIINEFKQIEDNLIMPSGFSALEYLKISITNPDTYIWPELILLDVFMPEVDGFDFLDEYENFPSELRKKTKIILISSGYKNPKIEQELHLKRVSKFILKPFTMCNMTAIMAEYENNKAVHADAKLPV